MQKEYLVPGAILLGCALIAAGVFFGLRSQPAAPPPTPITASPGVPGEAAGAQRAPPQPRPAPQRDVQAVVEASAKAALLAAKKATWGPRCWEPALEHNPQPARSRYSVQMNFDPEGKEITRGIGEERDVDSRPDVAQCLRNLPLGLSVPPPGVVVMVTLPLEFP